MALQAVAGGRSGATAIPMQNPEGGAVLAGAQPAAGLAVEHRREAASVHEHQRLLAPGQGIADRLAGAGVQTMDHRLASPVQAQAPRPTARLPPAGHC